MREEIPLTMGLFFRLCTFLIEHLGYPVHWISNIIDTILSSDGWLITRAKILDKTPREWTGYATKKDRVNLKAFYLEFVTQTSIWRQKLIHPAITTPLRRIESIHMYTIVDLKYSICLKLEEVMPCQ